MNATGQRICLNMIVRNEAPVIRRCLASVLPLIDTWVIVDTGSDDGTQQIIRDFMAAVPGELHERQWVNFAQNRTEALALARGKADYIFVIDADEILEIDPGFELPPLTHDSCNVQVTYGNTRYLRRQMVRDALPWRYEGVLHEYITCEEARTEQFLPGLTTIPHHDGARARDPLTYKKDAAILEKALTEDPSNTRYAFYLAQSYRDAGDLEDALRAYQRRAQLGGWIDEVWFSHYQIAQIRERLKHPWPEVMEAYLTAFQTQSHRAGPLYRIAMHYQAKAQYAVSFVFLERARHIPAPGPEALFVEHTLYDYQIALDHAVAAYYVGDHALAIRGNNQLLRSGRLPAFAIDQVVKNRRFSLDVQYNHQARDTTPPPPFTIYVSTASGTGLELDDCLHSLLQQQDRKDVRVVVLAEHMDSSLLARVQLSADFSVALLEGAEWLHIQRDLREASPEAVALLLPSNLRLAAPTTLQEMRRLFCDPLCGAAYAQWRRADGRMGCALPPADAQELEDRAGALPDGGLLLVRNSLLQSVQGAEVTGENLLKAAGMLHLRFADEVWSTAATGNGSTPAASPSQPAPQAVGETPLISCLMVTLDRLALAKESIRSFARQTYPRRELVIVTDGAAAFRDALERFVDNLGLQEQVRFVYPEAAGHTLGHLRNLAMEAASGDILCQWDDDDINHPDRLLHQAQHLIQNNAAASFLSDHLQLIEEKRAVCWVDWAPDGPAESPAQLFPGTLMMRRDPRFRYPEQGRYSRQGEDSALLYMLHETVPVVPLSGAGHLYLYRYHGRNTFPREHHYGLARFRKPVKFLQEHKDALCAAVQSYGLPQPCYAVGREGIAFVFE